MVLQAKMEIRLNLSKEQIAACLSGVRSKVAAPVSSAVEAGRADATPPSDRLRETAREQTGRHVSSKVVLDALRSESREQAKVWITRL